MSKLPKLPEPWLYPDPRLTDETYPAYTAEQVEQIRRETLEACAQVCAHLSTRAGTADECEAAILALLPVKEPKE